MSELDAIRWCAQYKALVDFGNNEGVLIDLWFQATQVRVVRPTLLEAVVLANGMMQKIAANTTTP